MITLTQMANPQISFIEVPYAQVPFRKPRTTASGTEGSSQFDNALAVIKRGAGQFEWKKMPTCAIRFDGDAAERKAVKAKLQTMGRKRGCVVEVLDNGQSVYAWASERGSSDRCFR
jgi:hypothetical protein